MGVRGLQTYLEKNCKTSVCIQSIEELANMRRTSEDQEVVIVVDGINCIRNVYRDSPWIGGGRLREYGEKIEKFVKAFREVGIRLVFFFDGNTVQRKRATRAKRYMATMDKAYHILDKLDEGAPSDPNSFNTFFLLPLGVFREIKLLLENICKCEVHSSVFECDEEIADFARRKGVFGILAHDTDFLIFDIGQAIYFDMEKLDLNMLTTRVYYPEVLAQSLGLTTFQLPLLATLIGNDIMKYDDLRNFHHKILSGKPRRPKFLVPSVAQFINTLPVYFLRHKDFLEVSKNVFGKVSHVRDIETSFQSYRGLVPPEKEQVIDPDCHSRRGGAMPESKLCKRYGNLESNEFNWRDRNSENWRLESKREKEDKQWLKVTSQAVQLHHENKMSDKVFAIIKNQLFEAGTSFEDYRIVPRDLPIFAELTLELRQRLYGILLQQKPVRAGSHSVEEWCMAGPGSLERATYVSAVAPSVDHPGLLALWGAEDRPEGRLGDARWTLFVRSISPRLDVQRVRLLPPRMVMPTLILRYVLDYGGPGRLEEWEADVFLATAAVLPNYRQRRLAAICPDPMTSRSVRVSYLLMRTGSMLYSLLTACGYPLSHRDTGLWTYFEEKLFQLKYRESQNYLNFHEQLCDNRADSLEIFVQARSTIFDNCGNK